MTLTRRFVSDLVERALRTFAQAYLAVWAAAGARFDRMLTLDGLKVALAATGFAVLTAIVAKPVNNPESASVLPPEAQPPAPLPFEPGALEGIAPAAPAQPVQPPPVPVAAPQPQPAAAFGGVDMAVLLELARLVSPVAAPPPPPPPPVTPGVPNGRGGAGFVTPPAAP